MSDSILKVFSWTCKENKLILFKYLTALFARFHLNLKGETEPIELLTNLTFNNKVVPRKLTEVVNRNFKDLLKLLEENHSAHIICESESNIKKNHFFSTVHKVEIPHFFQFSLNTTHEIPKCSLELISKDQKALVARIKINSILETAHFRLQKELRKRPFNQRKSKKAAKWAHKALCNLWKQARKEREIMVILWSTFLGIGKTEEPDEVISLWSRMMYRLH